MREGRCWYTECHAAGAMVSVDGVHERSLCPKHADGIRTALDQPGTYKVSWGRSKEEQIVEQEGRIGAAEAALENAQAAVDAYGPPRDDPDTELDESGLDVRFERLTDAVFFAEEEVAEIDARIGELLARTWDHPIVRVTVRTSA